MRTAPRLYVPDDLPGQISLCPAHVNYVRNVLRLSPGQSLTLFNGRDGEWTAELLTVEKKTATAAATERVRGQTPAPTLTLAFAPLKQARLDYMVEKAAEMGAGRLQPVLTQHTQVRRLNIERLQANIVEACEQCGILTVPPIAEPLPFATFLGTLAGPLVAADEALAGPLTGSVETIRSAAPPLTVLIGPEGGFSEAEREQLATRAQRISLGPRILRADTAAVALLTLVEVAHPSASDLCVS